MKMSLNIMIVLFFSFLPYYCLGQLNYIGLKKTAMIPPNNFIQTLFLPKCKVIGDYAYVCTNTGIYKKDLTITNDTIWELFALKDTPVTEFIKKGDSILAILPKSQGDLLLLSTNNGASFVNHTSNHFFSSENYNYLYRIAQNKQNPNSIVVLHACFGVSKSDDFGRTWKNLNTFTGGYQDRFVDFHPADSQTIYHTGETEFFSSYVQTSFDGGMTWTMTELEDNNCTHNIAFHPTNPDIIISGGEGRITQSTDKGRTWNPALFLDRYLYIFKIIFDESNPNIVYATGGFPGENDSVYIYRSLDTGNKWELYYKKDMEKDCGGIIDMEKYQDNLILYTLFDGIYKLHLDTETSIKEISNVVGFDIYPNPAKNDITIRLSPDFVAQSVEILDISGRIVARKNIDNHTDSGILLSLSGLNIRQDGIYLVKVAGKTGTYTQQLMVRE